jgi:hypothetical protein
MAMAAIVSTTGNANRLNRNRRTFILPIRVDAYEALRMQAVYSRQTISPPKSPAPKPPPPPCHRATRHQGPGLLLVVPIVGDIHQPLHSTSLFSVDQFPKGDLGGNEIPLVPGRKLHALWDGLLGTQTRLNDVDKAAFELLDQSRFGDVLTSAAKQLDFEVGSGKSRVV